MRIGIRQPAPGSLRRRLLASTLVPIGVLIGINTYSLYEQAHEAADRAYDKTLLAMARTIAERLGVEGYGAEAKISASLVYSSLEVFETDRKGRLFYLVRDREGRFVAGHKYLPAWTGDLPPASPQGTRAAFYNDDYQGIPVRMAVLMQPVVSHGGLGIAVIHVAETLDMRREIAAELLLSTLWRQSLLFLVIILAVYLGVQSVTRPVRQLSAELGERDPNALSPISAPRLPRELQPLLEATNAVMSRMNALIAHQKRFVRDASHQLRTPLAVLKVQVQSALRGDVPALQALQEISRTADRATELANQMLALAKVEQLRYVTGQPAVDLAEVLHGVALDLSALIVDKHLDFAIETEACPVAAHRWMLSELCRNLLHNAIQHVPDAGLLRIALLAGDGRARLRISNSGEPLPPEQREKMFQPFVSGKPHSGFGLGLAICREIVDALGGEISLDNTTLRADESADADDSPAADEAPCADAPDHRARQAAASATLAVIEARVTLPLAREAA